MPPLNGIIFLICDAFVNSPLKQQQFSWIFNARVHKMDVLVIFTHIELRIATG